MEIPAAPLTCLRLALVCALFAAAFAPRTCAAPKDLPAGAPPQPIEQKVTVKRGGSVEIPLRIFGTRAQTLSWIIRQTSAHGKLSPIRATAPEAAVVTYTPTGDLRFTADRFTFSVRSNEGVSAVAEVLITITDEEPRLAVPDALDFGTLLTGETATKLLELSNVGGGTAEGEIAVDAPWRLEGACRYRLVRDERHIAKLVFAPERGGVFESELRYSSQPDRTTILRGTAFDPLAISPAELRLTPDRGQPLRAGGCLLSNHTDRELEVAIAAGSRLMLPASLTLPPGGSTALTVQLPVSDAAALDETVRFTAGPLFAQLRVKSDPLPAIVRARPEAVVFRRLNPGVTMTERVTLENAGGVETQLAIAVGAPFMLSENALVLAPKAAREIVVTLAAAAPGSLRAALKVAGQGAGFDIPVEAEIASSATPALPSLPAVAISIAPPSQRADEAEEPVAMGLLPAGVVSVSGIRATFEWPGELPPGVVPKCRLRNLALDPDGNLAISYTDYPDCTFGRRPGFTSCTVEKLEPGHFYYFLIEAPGTADQPATALTFVQISTPAPPPRAPWFTPARVLFFALAVLIGLQVWQRRRGG